MAAALPVIAQRGPTSLLPPGFGEEPAADTGDSTARSSTTTKPAAAAASKPGGLQIDLSGLGGSPAASVPEGDALTSALAETVEVSPEEMAAHQAKYDLPANARRSLDTIGPLPQEAGGLASNAFGISNGRYLATLMQQVRAPFVSRWASILLRRALLSATATPGDINGADWAAERAWLLVRMGEADAARQLVQSVDSDKFTRRLYSVAMQSYLATGDLAGLCPLTTGAQRHDETPGWMMAEAICAAYSGEQGTASAILNQAVRRGRVQGIDYRLSEKAVGAGINSRRSVKIEWEGVDRLTAWRFGLATAVNVDIPAPLLETAGPRVRAWQARAPMLSLSARLVPVETAARMGVVSSAALVDFYAALAASGETPEGFDERAQALTDAYQGDTVGARLSAMRQWWGGEPSPNYVGLLAVSRAAALLPVTDADGADISHLIAAMMSAGYDRSAMRWAGASEQLASADGALGWALLAVGAPTAAVDLSVDKVTDFAGDQGKRGQMLVAALAGLGRLSGQQASEIATDQGFAFNRRTVWSKAIADAALRGETGTVALLAAVGLQADQWNDLPVSHLYHIVSALRRVGLDGEARMIAAEAVMRS